MMLPGFMLGRPVTVPSCQLITGLVAVGPGTSGTGKVDLLVLIVVLPAVIVAVTVVVAVAVVLLPPSLSLSS